MSFKVKNLLLLITFQLFACYHTNAQKVGVVLSGGGASGMAHIGVLKALEENNIPIDYITGTSMGALVGAMYAIGFSPKQIEQIVSSENFRNWAYGNIDEKYVYYFKKKEENSSWLTLKLSLDSTLETSLPTNIISPIPIDFALMKITSPAIASANYDFDSLFVPFRCLASDIEAKKSVIFKNGDLGIAVRASMSYPFYLKPVSIEGKLLFDGGIYNNFPSNIMYEDFFPDIIIGSNVTGNSPPPSEDNLISQLKAMLLTKTKFDVICDNGVIIEPHVKEISTFDFDDPKPLIDSGYTATLKKLTQIKARIQRRVSSGELEKKRAQFLSNEKQLLFDNIYIEGLNNKQSEYVKKILSQKKKEVTEEMLEPRYFQVASDDQIKSIYPQALFNKQTGVYDLYLNIKKEKDIITQFGGNFSNRPISEGFLGIQYNHLGRTAQTIMANTYVGKLYTSVQIKARFDFPFKVPFYLEPNMTLNRWDFFRSSNAVFEDAKPSYLIQREEYGELNMGLPITNLSKLVIGTGIANLKYDYYQSEQFSLADTADRTNFNTFTSHLLYEKNTLNRKQYPSEGTYFSFKARYLQGEEFNIPGSTSSNTYKHRKVHEWINFKIVFENYYKRRGTLKLGVYVEGVYSTQTLFNNYSASILAAPAFEPIPECKTLFQKNYRAHKYMAGGLKNIISFPKKIELRVEGYFYLPYQQIIKEFDLSAGYALPFSRAYIIATSALVWHSPVGPLSVSANYYYKDTKPFTFLVHFGYILFNRKALD